MRGFLFVVGWPQRTTAIQHDPIAAHIIALHERTCCQPLHVAAGGCLPAGNDTSSQRPSFWPQTTQKALPRSRRPRLPSTPMPSQQACTPEASTTDDSRTWLFVIGAHLFFLSEPCSKAGREAQLPGNIDCHQIRLLSDP